ncbi:unnamed protein product, partial [Ectocarpus sp. 8 AP-2014]
MRTTMPTSSSSSSNNNSNSSSSSSSSSNSNDNDTSTNSNEYPAPAVSMLVSLATGASATVGSAGGGQSWNRDTMRSFCNRRGLRIGNYTYVARLIVAIVNIFRLMTPIVQQNLMVHR